MKKILALLLTLCCIVSLTACSSQQGQEEKPNGQDYFNGKVLEIHDTYILVECLDVTSGAITSGTTANVSTEVVNAHGIPEMNIGDNVRVVFTGIKEKDPVSFDTVFSIFLLDENGEVIPFDVVDTPNITGIVTKVYEHSFLMLGEPTESYPNAEEYSVSLKVENEDSYTSVAVGDEVIVYHNGEIAESDPLQINTVYSITLKTPAADNVSVPKELPGLKIAYGDEEITAWIGGHSWVYEDENGETNAITADSNHPLHCMETMSFIPVYATTVSHAVGYEPGQVTLNFDVEPTKITVYRYDVENTDETAGEEIIMDNGYVLDLAFGNYLYHIAAEWDYPDNELGGSGDYAFYTKAPEIHNPQTD